MSPIKKAVIVTGASRGLGQYVSQSLCAQYNVLACARNISETANYHIIKADVGNISDCKKVIDYVKNEKLNVYGLINNAAMGAFNQVITTPISKIRKIMDVNYNGAVYLMQELSKLMIKSGQGRIINIGSQTLALKTPFEAAYASSKAAIETFSKVFAKELAPFNITVNLVSPAVMDTKIIKGIPKDRIDYMLSQQAIAKPVEFSDVQNVIDFLLKEESHNITGQNIYLGGVII
ncbi:MAG: SDR family NAD(P)-dependent oxidoreductase [Bacteroidia bacterium]